MTNVLRAFLAGPSPAALVIASAGFLACVGGPGDPTTGGQGSDRRSAGGEESRSGEGSGEGRQSAAGEGTAAGEGSAASGNPEDAKPAATEPRARGDADAGP